ncbi:replication-relaxation family protein [Kitasatospora sp. NPDC059795]|uniref:replication-relaxation family protein n=1 Tax=Kitasatospora sp. NPDC059795 TaxID=3346949 RepID=UPI00364FF2DD
MTSQPQPTKPGRTAWVRAKAYPNGSTNSVREDVLTALGVLKVATADQLHRLLRSHLSSNKSIRAALLDLQLNGLTASDGNTAARHKTWRLDGPAGLDAAAHVLELARSDMGGTARGAGRTGAPHAMAVNETILAFVRGGTTDGATGGIGMVTSWSTETEFTLPGGKRKVRPDAVLQAPEIGMPVLMVEVDRSTMAPARVAAKLPAYRELFLRQVRDYSPTTPDRTTAWWRQAYPGHTRDGFPPIALVVTGTGPQALTNRLQAIYDLSREYFLPRRRKDQYGEDSWCDYDDAIPVIATTLELLQQYGPMGEVWWRFGRADHHLSLLDALEDWDTKAEYDERARIRSEEIAAENRRKIEAKEKKEKERIARGCRNCHQPVEEWRRRYLGDNGEDPLCFDCQEEELAGRRPKAEAEAEKAAEETAEQPAEEPKKEHTWLQRVFKTDFSPDRDPW